MTVKEVREKIQKRLQKAEIEDFEYEVWMLLEWKLGIGRAEYFMDPDREIPDKAWMSLNEVLRERERRVPLQYLMGSCEFMGYTFEVDERVLIPRQDTECLVELAVKKIRQTLREQASCQVLDICTGSGCIGISVKLLCPEAEVTLSDVSEGALDVAKKNAWNLGASVRTIESDLFENIQGSYDYILSNPPYIPSRVIEGLMPEVREFEPRIALDGTEDGLYFYRAIAEDAVGYLRPGGWLIFEIGQEQGEDLLSILREQGFENTEIKKDLAGLDRIAVGRWPENVEP
ncbi:protein-(glutamine-N5) methyltransferase, release factor-specific [Eubacterium sp. An11]|uniref:peptide chain release factor N(5)-glutamine methyltransferase n=1 Tax=Eubacterium sp. An11 TaxID=1965542 RepID=UPI000B37DD64|nr:peptide chain release factor N(5)-glutamine methyltransferase [Eubacterium sp. An11]OUQ64727.1 protein-(glutamine-N5) methyltransferase, release factor-specific [Eubacterium sp. An11]